VVIGFFSSFRSNASLGSKHINSFLLVLLDAFFSFSLMLFWGLHASFVLSSASLRLFS
jgi:hypothetical protein